MKKNTFNTTKRVLKVEEIWEEVTLVIQLPAVIWGSCGSFAGSSTYGNMSSTDTLAWHLGLKSRGVLAVWMLFVCLEELMHEPFVQGLGDV